jgi:hypothetical protein
MKTLRFPQDPLQPFQAGNVWELKDSFLLIGDVGKLLVNYRHYKGKDPKGPNTLTSKRDLGKYLIKNKATLAKR